MATISVLSPQIPSNIPISILSEDYSPIMGEPIIKMDQSVSTNCIDNSVVKTEKKVHQLRTAILGIDMPPPRFATLFRQILCNPEIETQVKELREHINLLAKTIKDQDNSLSTKDEIKRKIEEDSEIRNIKNQISDISKPLTRISNEAPIAMAIIMDFMIKEILEHAILFSRKSRSKMTEISHIGGEGVRQLTTYALFRTLPSFQNLYNMPASQRASPKVHNLEKGGAKHAVTDLSSKTSFVTYIAYALRRIRNQKGFEDARVQRVVRLQLSTLVSECSAKMINLTRVAMNEFAGIRTISAEHVKSITRVLLMAEGQSKENIKTFLDRVDEKLQIYQRYQLDIKDNKEKIKKDKIEDSQIPISDPPVVKQEVLDEGYESMDHE